MSGNGNYFRKLVELMATLRGPEGCPWDKEQTRETLMPMLIEEAYEVLEALDRGNEEELCEELGDLLFQIIFHSQISQEKGGFDAYQVCRRSYEKMVGRHPHVFGDQEIKDSRDLLKNWEDIKAAEKEAGGRKDHKTSLLDGIPERLPGMYEAVQITDKASRVGFDWQSLEGIWGKFDEEFDELNQAIESEDSHWIKEEVGDILFTAINVARFLSIDPETALKRANSKFAGRFRKMEEYFSNQGKKLKDIGLDEMEEQWKSIKEELPEDQG